MNQVLPLTINQREIYIEQMMWPEGTHLNIGATVTVHGAFNIEVFNEAMNRVICYHPGLRTRIYELEGNPLQTIALHKDTRVKLVDFSTYENSEEQAEDYINKQFIQPFHFGKDACLVDFQLIRTSSQKHIIFAKYHHTITDGWGTAIFFREVIVTYNQILKDGVATQTQKDWSLVEYLQQESEYLKSDNFQRDRDYWIKRLQGLSPKLFSQIQPQKLIGQRQSIYISRQTYDRVSSLCLAIQSNIFHFILSILTICLSNRYEKKDLVVGLSLLNRNKKNFKDAINLFVSTIPFRLKIDDNETLHQFLDNIRALLRQDYRHQRFPLAEMKRLTGLHPNSKEHFFEVYLSYEKHDYNENFANTQTNCVPLYSDQQRLPLIVYIREYKEDTDIKIDFDYNLSYLDYQVVTEILSNFQNLFNQAIENLEQTISSLLVKLPQTNHSIILQPQISLTPVLSETLISAFDRIACQYPENIAVQFNKTTLTYTELNRKANCLANYLISQGVKQGLRVGICLERSENIVVAILAILKTGAAYVPIEPDSPTARLQLILQDSGISALICEEAHVSQFAQQQILAFTLNSIANELTETPDISPQVLLKPEFPAYVIYTSGTTGTPKGCVVTHGNVIRLMRSTEHWFGFNNKDIWTLFHSFAFDFSVWELWGALLYGGKVIIVPFWLSRATETFREFLTTEKVTVLNQTPSAFYQLIRADEASGGQLALRYVIFGGEALDLSSLHPWLERYGDRSPRLINMYGITETTVHLTYHPISHQDLTRVVPIIGREIPDLCIYLLNEKQEPVAEGLPGEIYVAGAGVSYGYLNRPSLTAERYLPNPFGEGRLYRSGDLGRRMPNGELEYLGRIDQQVKIRGFRIELGEIKAALTSHFQVREALILTDEWEGEKRLVAYYVPGESNPTAYQLRQYLKTKLPEYMIPAAYVSLETFPLNINGKIDTKALPAPDWNSLREEEKYVAARNVDEECLSAIFAETLGIKKVGIDDNFFDIGGDSILALQVVAKAKKAGFALSTRELYESTTVRQLATKKAAVTVTNSKDVLVADLLSVEDRKNLPEEAEDAYPLSSLQAGMVYHTERHPTSAIFHQIFTFDLVMKYSEIAWEKAITDICQAHPGLRTSFHWIGYTTPIQIVHREVERPLTVVDLRHFPGNAHQQVAEWIETEKNRPFDITKPPLFRFQIHRLSDTELSFSFSFHHGILDGWSVATLLTQLLQRYVLYLEAGEMGTVPGLQVPQMSYKDFIVQEQQAIASPEQQEFWQQHLNHLEITTLPRLPLVNTGNLAQRQLKRLSITIDQEVTDSLRKLSKRVGVPLKTSLLAVHLRVLSFLTGQKEVVSGNVINSRPETLDSKNLLGLFVNTVPFRISLSDGSWLELIQDVFRAEKEIFGYQSFPLVEMQRLIKKRPLFEVGFNYVHFHVYEGLLNLPQIQVQNVEIFEETDFPFLVEFCLVPGSTALQLNLIYDTQQFDTLQIQQYSKYYQAALNDISAYPQALYGRRSLITAQEQQHLLELASSNTASIKTTETLVSAFERVAAKYANKIAITWQETTLTFAELEIHANRLAHYLQKQGVARERLVGLCLERSPQMVIAILAILKAGGAYVPIDPSYPKERIEFLLQDSGIIMLLTQKEVVLQLSGCQTPIIILEDIERDLLASSTESLAVQILPENPAYIIYTSGSTGKPKGCIVTHANVMRLFKATESWFGFNSEDVWTLFHSYAFDFSVWEIWGGLLYGGRVVIVPYWISRSPQDFLQLVQQQEVTVLNQTPSAFKQLIQAATDKKPEKLYLRYIIFGGEALELASLQPWIELYGCQQPKLINMYGITETTVHATYKKLTEEDKLVSKGSAIGQSIPDLNIYILDENLEPMPIGIPGEIYIGGAGVTRGYLSQPRLTAERFVPNPFAQTPGCRLYRSGDLGRRLPNREVEYIGRADQQVKIRGFRIELEEITAALKTHPQVKEAVATAQPSANGHHQLVAYFISDTKEDLRTTLPQFLKSKLPDYMIPSAFVPLKVMPLTVNGKLDQNALPEVDWNWTNPYLAPSNDQEATICSLMASLLKIERVGASDDFFEIGGDSLLITQLAMRLRQTYQTEFSLPQLFTHRTPQAIARLLPTSATGQKTTTNIPKAERQRRFIHLSDDGLFQKGDSKP
ncbi:non-ribosomal peptide synthase involved in Hassallidin biosynthesis [Planktothrix serta PCC 8927]|uniref:Non-ribosomal peptide synthase involved in Hassallidin biosynthesis n=1 Tax=Planktothrix serta PCC 8927 TaxID=671068 RepID=A0A1J1JQW9_9CYAN|nr:non-ribosomal peptide synthetase [Planktothrix serta]CZT62792.1 non-ribosomal peptide synthase involved in Hassallidin biosynthesis [Planktothrix serta PCC 8927]VXD10565.1 non-ribosomal peptide synthase involved in Hassallidin biosynthesis [Planktothrix serta PCC 8927]